MFDKILVALDRSERSPIVFKQALEIASAPTSKMLLFHCLDWDAERAQPLFGVGTLGDIKMTPGPGLRHESLQKDLEQVRQWLEDYRQQALSCGIVAELKSPVGSPGARICEQARHWGAAVIVLGRRGRRGLSEVLLGSVSSYVVHHADCSVLIVQ
ncbi:MAG: universal stress protein [Cyanophyceae cyanobacterium]